MIPANIRQYLGDRGVPFRVCLHAPAVTAQRTAAECHISGKRLAKTVILQSERSFWIAVLPAADSVHLGRLGEALGERLTLAHEEEFIRLFPGCEAGAEPPLGDLYQLPVVVDAALARQPTVYFNGGTHTDLIEMRWEDFRRLVKPRILEYGARRAR